MMSHEIFIKNHNPLFVKEYAAKNGGATVEVQQSHGGSSKQALAVANGLAADVVTMNQTSDIELLVKKVWSKPVGTPVCRTMPCLIPVTSFSWYAKAIQNTSRLGRFGQRRRTNRFFNPKTTGNGRYAFGCVRFMG